MESHAHDSDELLYVLSGAIDIDGRRLEAGGVVYIPRGTSYSARVSSDAGSRVLRIEFPNGSGRAREAEYDARPWLGPLTEEGVPNRNGSSEGITPG